MNRTSDFNRAMEWAVDVCGELNLPRVWIPEKAFVEAVRDGENLSFIRKTETGLFGLAIGANPIILPGWNEFALPQSISDERTKTFTHHANWEAHALKTSSRSYEIEPLEDDEFITDFLSSHAPNSSAKPGNPEIKFWGAVRNNDGEIAAIAAITEWESGESMLSSVATHTEMRGQGFAQRVTEGLVGLAYDRGIERITLIVLSSNIGAIKVYSRSGFNLIGKFASYSKS